MQINADFKMVIVIDESLPTGPEKIIRKLTGNLGLMRE